MTRRGIRKAGKRDTESTQGPSLAFLISVTCGAVIGEYSDAIFNSLTEGDGPVATIPMWRVHMSSACFGTSAFTITLFLVRALELKSKKMAMKSAARWVPLVGMTGLAALIHIPSPFVFIGGGLYSVWGFWRYLGERKSVVSTSL